MENSNGLDYITKDWVIGEKVRRLDKRQGLFVINLYMVLMLITEGFCVMFNGWMIFTAALFVITIVLFVTNEVQVNLLSTLVKLENSAGFKVEVVENNTEVVESNKKETVEAVEDNIEKKENK